MSSNIVKKGDKISVEYTGKLETGETFDSSKGKEPLQFEVGTGRVIRGFDHGVIGMKVGEEKTISINPEEAYGQRNDAYIKELPKQSIPKELELKEGLLLIFKKEDGMRMPATVVEVKEDTVMVDFNHPLAGHKLVFEIKIISIN